jgi:hypothetical protein
MKLRTIFQDCDIAVQESIVWLYENRPNYFLLFLARGEYFPNGENVNEFTPYLLDYMPDLYNNHYQRKFIVDYLQRNYSKEGFAYQEEKDINDLITEMLIYSHIWEDVGFLKLLVRLAELIDARDYAWSIDNIDYHNKLYEVINERIITSLKNQNLILSKIIEAAHCRHIRDAFAHSMYSIDFEKRVIQIWGGRTATNKWSDTISFDVFQEKFLKTIKTWNQLYYLIDQCRYCAAKDHLDAEIPLPNAKKLYIYATMKDRGESQEPGFFGSVYNEDVSTDI